MFKKSILPTAALISLLALPAFAADLPNIKGPPVYAPPPVPVFTWTGFYLGGDLGYQWGQNSGLEVRELGLVEPLPELNHNDNGIVGSIHAGYNYQIMQFVLGIEGDVSGSSDRGSAAFDGVVETTKVPIEGSLRGRVGVAWDRVLFFGTGGVTFASIHSTLSEIGFLGSVSRSTGRAGWTVGGGVEYAIDNNWSIRAQYLYSNYGHVSYDLGGLGFPNEFISKRVTDNRAEAGFSYKFDFLPPPAPVVAKY